MIFKPFQDLKLSALGFGTMRLPTVNGNDSDIDEKAAAELVDYAMKNGVNYYDTAWGYHNGNSEIAVGKILKNYPREKFYLASKFPGYDLSNMTKVKEIFEKQLEKCLLDLATAIDAGIQEYWRWRETMQRHYAQLYAEEFARRMGLIPKQ